MSLVGPTYKDPVGVKIRGIDYAGFVASFAAAPTLVRSEWVADAGITVTDNGIDGARTSCKIAGGTAGVDYWVENRAEFDNGAIEVRGFYVHVRDKIPAGGGQ